MQLIQSSRESFWSTPQQKALNPYSHSLIISREVLILTLQILIALQGCISWYIPRDGLMTAHCLSQVVLGCTMYIPSDVPQPSGNLLVLVDVQHNTSLLSAVYGYNNSDACMCNARIYDPGPWYWWTYVCINDVCMIWQNQYLLVTCFVMTMMTAQMLALRSGNTGNTWLQLFRQYISTILSLD